MSATTLYGSLTRRYYTALGASLPSKASKKADESPNPFHQNRARTSEPMPTKDRFPPPGYDKSDSRIRLAALIDASKISPELYEKELLPVLSTRKAIMKDYVVLLHRIFGHEISSEWKRKFGPENLIPEPFIVESFIPVNMQMAADAYHISEYRSDNRYGGVLYFCGTEDRVSFELLTQRMSGHGMHQLILDTACALSKH